MNFCTQIANYRYIQKNGKERFITCLTSPNFLVSNPKFEEINQTRNFQFSKNSSVYLSVILKKKKKEKKTKKKTMSNLRMICRPHTLFSTFVCCRDQSRRFRVSFRNPNYSYSRPSSPSVFTPWFDSTDSLHRFRFHQRRTLVRASNWADVKSPYETLELEGDADDETIKSAYRRLAKFYHPDVYDGRGTLDEGETAEARFIKIQAAYELLIDREKRRQYDMDNRVNPMKASQAWMEWLMKKRKAFDQRGDMAIAAWAEQQQLQMNLRARRLSRSKIDPEEERKLLAKEKKASMEYFSSTLKRHTLVLRKRDIMRRKAEEEKKKVINQLLAAEGLELDTDDETQ
ncbi:DnaJ domain [Dillenia turbinata]|uniref:DnaJ domain n=1 Tax=Dillenia turbinata TaxID=194707 RepID=A0AAN8ZJG5_9MAGN